MHRTSVLLIASAGRRCPLQPLLHRPEVLLLDPGQMESLEPESSLNREVPCVIVAVEAGERAALPIARVAKNFPVIIMIDAGEEPAAEMHALSLGAHETVLRIDEISAAVARARARFDSSRHIRERERMFTTLCDALPYQMAYRIAVPPEGAARFVYVSEGVKDISGLTKEDVLSDSASLYNQIVPEDRERLEVIERHAVEHLLPLQIEVRKRDVHGVLKWVHIRSTPSREPDGTIIWDGVETNISAYKQSEARFAQLADAMPQIVWTATPRGEIEYFNSRWHELTGAAHDLSRLEAWQNALEPGDLDRWRTAWREAVETGSPLQIELRLAMRENGCYRWFLNRALPVRNDEGDVERWFGTCTDIDEHKRLLDKREELLESERHARAESERLSRMKDEFLATLSHELRTPINAVLGWARLVKRGRLKGEDFKGAIDTIERNAHVQARLIDDLLDMNRIVSGKVTLQTEAIDVRQFLLAAADNIRPAADAKQVSVELDFHPKRDLYISGDSGKLQQVINNLLSNAVKFTPAGGAVTLGTDARADSVDITVSDTGVGIKPDFLPFVFDRFRQEDASTSRRFGGLGLGLAIVKHLTELHRGSVRAESKGEGKGAVFTLTFPLVSSPALSLLPDLAAKNGQTTTLLNGVRVLLVDDEYDSLELVRHVLVESGASVTTAQNAFDALAALSRETPDVLVSDIGMSGMDGYELIRELRRSSGASRTVPAIALTAFARPEDRRQILAAGYQLHLPKPVNAVALQVAISQLVDSMNQRRAAHG